VKIFASFLLNIASEDSSQEKSSLFFFGLNLIVSGEKYKTLNSHKYGVDFARFVHSGAQSCICASRSDYDCKDPFSLIKF
jgi:hypothetical protein